MNQKARAVPLSMALIAMAGCVDAVGYLRLGHLFVSFMSGNSTELAVAAAQGKPALALRAASVVASFVLGVVIGKSIDLRAGRFRRRAVLLTEAALLALAAFLSPRGFADAIPMVLAMGLQNAAWHDGDRLKTSRTYVTGALVSLGEHLAEAVSGPRLDWVPFALMWLGMVAGALVGALAYGQFGLFALLLPAVAAASLAMLPIARA